MDDATPWCLSTVDVEDRFHGCNCSGSIRPPAILRDNLDSTFLAINDEVLTGLTTAAIAARHHGSGILTNPGEKGRRHDTR